MNDEEQSRTLLAVFHLRKLKPNCSFTPSALPLGASLRPSPAERTPHLISLQAKFNFLSVSSYKRKVKTLAP
jgi:hypothetical protein